MLLLTTRGGARYRKLPEGTITPLRQAQQTEPRVWSAVLTKGRNNEGGSLLFWAANC